MNELNLGMQMYSFIDTWDEGLEFKILTVYEGNVGTFVIDLFSEENFRYVWILTLDLI